MVQLRHGQSLQSLPSSASSDASVLQCVPRGEHEGVAEISPTERGGSTPGSRSRLRQGLPPAREVGEAALPMRQPQGGDAPRRLLQAAEGDLDVSGVSSRRAQGRQHRNAADPKTRGALGQPLASLSPEATRC